MTIYPGYLPPNRPGALMICEMTAEVDGVIYRAKSTHGATSELCRVLVEAGIPDGPWEARRNGRVAFSGPSIHRMATLTMTEGIAQPLRYVKWAPFPRDVFAIAGADAGG